MVYFCFRDRHHEFLSLKKISPQVASIRSWPARITTTRKSSAPTVQLSRGITSSGSRGRGKTCPEVRSTSGLLTVWQNWTLTCRGTPYHKRDTGMLSRYLGGEWGTVMVVVMMMVELVLMIVEMVMIRVEMMMTMAKGDFSISCFKDFIW